MIAINWYRVLLPSNSSSVFCVQVPKTGRERIIERPRCRYPVVTVDDGRIGKIHYHITSVAPLNCEQREIEFGKYRSVTKAILGYGLAIALETRGCFLRRNMVGYEALIDCEGSLDESIYQTQKGIEFREFFFEGRGGEDSWGFVISYRTSQRFVRDLTDPLLQEMACGSRIIRVGMDDREDSSQYSSLIFKSTVNKESGIAETRYGEEKEIQLCEWTLVCKSTALSEYLRKCGRNSIAQEVTRSLQKLSFSLSEDGRMNTSILRDQTRSVEGIVKRFSLESFPLPIPGMPHARLISDPLGIGELQ